MTSDQAVFVREMLLGAARDEAKTTRKVIAAIPDGAKDYRPDPKARTAFELAWHIVHSEAWFLDGILKGQFGTEGETIPDDVKSVADVLAWYDKNFPALADAVDKMPADQLVKPISFFGLMENAGITYINFLLAHSVHHRGQLSVYLRPMGSKVPSIYGGSADEPFQMPAGA